MTRPTSNSTRIAEFTKTKFSSASKVFVRRSIKRLRFELIVEQVEFDRTTIRLFFQNGIELTDARFYAKVELDQLEKIFNVAGDPYSVLPMLEERQRVLNETGSILLEVR